MLHHCMELKALTLALFFKLIDSNGKTEQDIFFPGKTRRQELIIANSKSVIIRLKLQFLIPYCSAARQFLKLLDIE